MTAGSLAIWCGPLFLECRPARQLGVVFTSVDESCTRATRRPGRICAEPHGRPVPEHMITFGLSETRESQQFDRLKRSYLELAVLDVD